MISKNEMYRKPVCAGEFLLRKYLKNKEILINKEVISKIENAFLIFHIIYETDKQ